MDQDDKNSPRPVRLRAFVQMGSERRETVIEIPREEYEAGDAYVERTPGKCLELWLENIVDDWVAFQYGWGWSGCGYENDFSCMEGSDAAWLGVTVESAIPNTVAFQVPPRCLNLKKSPQA